MNKIKCIFVLVIWLSVLSIALANDINSGNAAFDRGDFAEAVRYYERGLTDKKSANVYISLGHAQERLGQWNKAVEAYISAIKIQKTDPSNELLKLLGRAQYMAGFFENSLDTFQKIYIADRNSENELWLARCFIQTQQWARGQDILLRYLDKEPQSTEALELLAYLFAQSNRIDEAVGVHMELVKNHPVRIQYLLTLAKIQTAAKHYGQAIDTLEFAALINPNQTREAIRLLADLYAEREMYYQAAACYQRIILSSDSPLVEDYYRLGYTYFQIGEFPSAIQAFEKIRQIAPSNTKATLYLGHIAAKKDETETARQYYLDAIKLNKDSKEPYLALAELDLKNDKYDEAAKYFSKAITLGENSIAVYYNNVLVLMLSGQLDMAKAAIKEALKQYPANEQLNNLLEQLIKTTIAN
ncbi:MAG: tetratricopeptide repeat protein [Phycisphaerae bacterium]|nr:tetratricopeptide repeat protein [Phycisphaerae bacterium]